MKVQCPNCKRKLFETTDRFDPDKTPNGGMVKCLLPYQIDWLCSSTTLAAEMTCPECLAPLVHNGKLCVLYPARSAGEFFKDETIAADSADATVNSHLDEKPDDSPAAPPEPMPKVGERVYICDVCGKECKTALALAGHKRSHK